MKSVNLTVEIEDSKRFAVGKSGLRVEGFRPSTTTREAGDKVYHQYTGPIVQAEASDFATPDRVAAMAARIHADLYAGDGKISDPLAALADVLNNGGLRLAYGDAIKGQHKTGSSGSWLKIRNEVLTKLVFDQAALAEFQKIGQDSAKQDQFLRDYWEQMKV